MTASAKKAQGGEKGKGARTPEQMLVVTPEEVEALCLQLRGGNMGGGSKHDEQVGAFLLVIHSLAYCDLAHREDYLWAAERAMLTYTHAFAHAAASLIESAVCTVRGTKARRPQEGGAS